LIGVDLSEASPQIRPIAPRFCHPSIKLTVDAPFERTQLPLLPFYKFRFLSSSLLFFCLVSTPKMSASAKRRLAALSEQLVSPIPDQGQFEDLPVLKKIAPDSTGPRVKGKVVIVTGKPHPITPQLQDIDPEA
jgi:hypothetical protein